MSGLGDEVVTCMNCSIISTNLHSGVDGGAVIEPATELCKLVASLTDSSGRVTVPE